METGKREVIADIRIDSKQEPNLIALITEEKLENGGKSYIMVYNLRKRKLVFKAQYTLPYRIFRGSFQTALKQRMINFSSNMRRMRVFLKETCSYVRSTTLILFDYVIEKAYHRQAVSKLSDLNFDPEIYCNFFNED